jgi:hypothetical protein
MDIDKLAAQAQQQLSTIEYTIFELNQRLTRAEQLKQQLIGQITIFDELLNDGIVGNMTAPPPVPAPDGEHDSK